MRLQQMDGWFYNYLFLSFVFPFPYLLVLPCALVHINARFRFFDLVFRQTGNLVDLMSFPLSCLTSPWIEIVMVTSLYY